MTTLFDWQAERDAALETVERNAGEDFKARAMAFALDWMAGKGIVSGEDITDACKAAGIVPHEDRAFGPVYLALARCHCARWLHGKAARPRRASAGLEVGIIRFDNRACVNTVSVPSRTRRIHQMTTRPFHPILAAASLHLGVVLPVVRVGLRGFDE